jgi:hypothetical protein
VSRRRGGSSKPCEGAAAVVDLAVELSLKLGEALEEIAVDRGLAAADLAEVWWVD